MRQAGFEPATRCLEGTSEASRYVASNGGLGGPPGDTLHAFDDLRPRSAAIPPRNGPWMGALLRSFLRGGAGLRSRRTSLPPSESGPHRRLVNDGQAAEVGFHG